jgi:hypothetical protein
MNEFKVGDIVVDLVHNDFGIINAILCGRGSTYYTIGWDEFPFNFNHNVSDFRKATKEECKQRLIDILKSND